MADYITTLQIKNGEFGSKSGQNMVKMSNFSNIDYINHNMTSTLPQQMKRKQMKKRYGETAERIYREIQIKKLLEQKKKIIKKKLKQIEKETNK